MQIIFLGDQVHETWGCCHLLIQQQLRCLCLGTRVIDKVASVKYHPAKSLSHLRNEDLANFSHFSVIVGKALSRCRFVSVGLRYFHRLTQDGGTYLGERYLDLKVPTEQIQAAAKPERPTTNLCFVFIIWGYIWNTPPGLTSQLQGLGMWGIELNSAAPLLPPLQKNVQATGKEAHFKVIFYFTNPCSYVFPH